MKVGDSVFSFSTYMTKKHVRPLADKMKIGIEKESQRVTFDGKLAKTDHPQEIGSRSYHPMIQTDFSETQVELITPVCSSTRDVMDFLAALHEVILRSMPRDEMLWPLSMPPKLPEKSQDIKIAKLERKEEVLYRRYLAKTYGKRKQMVSGIHYNFEFAPEFLKALFEVQEDFNSYEEMRDEIYLTVAQNYLHERWLVTYLYGASPFSEWGYFKDSEDKPAEPVRSIRNSHFGYANHETVKAVYDTVANHARSIESLVEKGILSEEKEFYAPIRLRGGKKVADLKKYGVHYIEVRNIDLNPFAPYGIQEEQVRFLQLFLMLMLWRGKTSENSDAFIAEGDQWNNQVALENPLAATFLQERGMQLIQEMKEMIDLLQLPEDDVMLIEKAAAAFSNPALTLAGKMVMDMADSDTTNHQFAVEIGRHNVAAAYEKPYQLAGFRDMELSTQLVMFEAIKLGIKINVLDRSDQFLKLTFGEHQEYVKNGNMTAKDTYIAALIMENKVVTKKILAQAGFRVPGGAEYDNLDDALKGYPLFAERPIVVKPKTTNYGLGISIFKERVSFENYQEAVELAFAEDRSILVEEFIAGTEYRFFIVNGQTEAIMKRVPANVEGDGVHTIKELVVEKNQDPLRDKGYRSPLEKIQLGEIERLMLQEQSLDFDSIPIKGQIVFLRENSNVSTGGDSIDQTDDVDESYKQIAEAAVASLGVEICGIDLIIPDINSKATTENYGIIEANFNPAMHMHAFPYQGKSQNLARAVLKLLFPEAFKK